jgi:regulatory protein
MKMAFGRPKKAAAPLNEAGLYEYAVRTLGRMMRTEAELRRLMSTRVEPGESGQKKISAVVAKLHEYGFLDDRSFAETYTRLRQSNQKLGARRVRQDLQRKGVGAELIDEAVTARYGSMDEETLVREHLEQKRLKKPANEKESARLMRRLVSAGFSVGVIYKVLRQWDVPEETLMALDSVEEERDGEE